MTFLQSILYIAAICMLLTGCMCAWLGYRESHKELVRSQFDPWKRYQEKKQEKIVLSCDDSISQISGFHCRLTSPGIKVVRGNSPIRTRRDATYRIQRMKVRLIKC